MVNLFINFGIIICVHRKNFSLTRLKDCLKVFDNDLDGRIYLVGGRLSSADLYLHITLSWLSAAKIDLASYANLNSLYNHISTLENVKAGYDLIKTNPKTTLAKFDDL